MNPIVIALAAAAAWFILARIRSGRRIQELRTRGALVLDVRSAGEFRQGQAPGALNLPLDTLPSQLGRLDKARPLLVCCASGARSALAARLLRAQGFEAFNAGSWTRLL
ncbi:MAG TPA: rhodanese-like domain-containing protein [Holophagaceae bacterium]|nr:rhodanese-like domain-containing protein [Holophagaceae bacterium]